MYSLHQLCPQLFQHASQPSLGDDIQDPVEVQEAPLAVPSAVEEVVDGVEEEDHEAEDGQHGVGVDGIAGEEECG